MTDTNTANPSSVPSSPVVLPENPAGLAPNGQVSVEKNETVVAKVHGAQALGDNLLWAGHGISAVLLLLGVTLVLLGPGPRRRDALRSLLEKNQEEQQQQQQTTSQGTAH